MPTRPPVYLVAGDDDLLLQRALERLLAELRADHPDLDLEQVDGAEWSGLPEMRTASLFGGTRVVVVRNVDRIGGEDSVQELVDYVSDPEPEAVLVLVSRARDRRQRLPKAVAQHGEIIEVAAPKPWDGVAWERLAREEFRRLGRDADAGAVRALLVHAGADASTVASKVAQVAAAAPAGERITAAQVEAAVEGHGNRGAFAIADAVAARDPAGALVALRGALDAGEAPLALLAAIVARMRQLLQVRGGAQPQDVGVSPGRYKHLLGAARGFHPGELPWCHDRLARADLDLKGSDLPPDLVLELAVVDAATSRRVGPPWNPRPT